MQLDSRICATLGVAHDATKTRVRLHLLLEHVDCDGDLHDTIHGAKHWESLRAGCDEATLHRRLAPRYAASSAKDDAWSFVMPRALKLKIAIDLSR